MTSTASSNGIEARGLVREFKNGPRAVDGIDLDVAPGEIYGFLGPNGAGKSTTVHMLTTLLPPSSGTARVAGHDIVREGPAVRDAIGVALQEAALDALLTGREHMKLQGGLHGLAAGEIKRRGDALLERVGLAEAADRRVGGYSGGMKRRLDLALALVHEPRLLFLDEPTTGLDIQSRAALWDEVAHLARNDGVTVFLTTQYLEEADQLADRVGIIDHGRLVAEGTPAALKAEIGRPTVEATPYDRADAERLHAALRRFGEETPAAPGAAAVRLTGGVEELTEIVRALDAEGIRIANLEIHAPSLDDVFLTKTGRRLEGATRRRGNRRADGRRGRAGDCLATRRVRDGDGSPASQAGALHGVARGDPDRSPADRDRAAARLPPLPARHQRLRPRRGDADPGLPHRFLPGVRARLPVHAGGDLRHQHGRHQHRPGHRQRLLQPPLADPDARLLAARRSADRGPAGGDDPGDRIPRPPASPPARTSRPAHWGCSSSSPCRC